MFIAVSVALVCSVGFTVVEGNPVSPSSSGNLIEVAEENGFNTFIELLTTANLNHILEGKEKYIIFAPTNQAFEEVGESELSRLKSNPVTLERTLLSHISQQETQPDGLFDGVTLKTLIPGEELQISFTGNGAFVNGKEFDENGIEAKNGIIYSTNKVLFSSVNNTNDIPIKEESSNSENLIQVLNNNGCKTLAQLITEVKLPDLETSGIYTIFAPNDEAFASLSSDELRVMKSNNILLKNLIKSHIIEGEFFSSNLEDGLIIESLSSGYSLKFLVEDDGSITVNNVPIITKDLKASNGVVNVISNILISSSKSLRSEKIPAVLKINENSFSHVEHEVGSFLEVRGLMDDESSKDTSFYIAVNENANNDTSFYIAVNENADLLPSTVPEFLKRNVGVDSSTQETSQNGEDPNTTPNENDAETAMNTLEVNKTESEQSNENKNKGDSSLHLDSVEHLKEEKQSSNNTSETKSRINEEKANKENLDNGKENITNQEGNLSTGSLTRELHGDSGLKGGATTENQEEDLTTTATVAAETEPSSQSESQDEEEVTSSTIATIDQ